MTKSQKKKPRLTLSKFIKTIVALTGLVAMLTPFLRELHSLLQFLLTQGSGPL